MKKNDSDKLFAFIVYILIGFLIIFVSYNSYINLLKKDVKDQTTQPPNSINVSPITGEVIQDVNTSYNLLKVCYNSSNITELYGINKADIVIETYNAVSNTLSYDGIFYNKHIPIQESIENISTISLDTLPYIDFIDPPDLDSHEFNENIDTIFIPFSDSISTSFIFQKGQYYHFSKNVKDVHKTSNAPLAFTNILIEFTSSFNDSVNQGLLFSGGKLQRLNIEGNNIKMINNSKEINLSLLRGNTIWIKCSDKIKIITANANIES
ncbi:hypothetical protein [Clostridium intestinale]|uniref:Uncharacterized protein n=1 Tax=Clostridium intestinale URNW TaxID=1294142 RepID=U2Q0Y7_9CLOT|nr:hypothetical protein [Clostridium intestinale]ERK32430.1 hypothetical protein CINTURNW_0090 [Clostridium intestinale URNW]